MDFDDIAERIIRMEGSKFAITVSDIAASHRDAIAIGTARDTLKKAIVDALTLRELSKIPITM